MSRLVDAAAPFACLRKVWTMQIVLGSTSQCLKIRVELNTKLSVFSDMVFWKGAGESERLDKQSTQHAIALRTGPRTVEMTTPREHAARDTKTKRLNTSDAELREDF